jgi:hypothetical protein
VTSFRRKQGATAIGIAAALVATAIGFSLPAVMPDFPNAPADAAQRIALWCAAETFVVFWLAVCVARLARHRFFDAADIDAGGASGSARALSLQAQLQNTLEQAVLAGFSHLAWLMLAPPAWGLLAVVFAAFFFVGRALFLTGYDAGAPARALGFGLTFYPSVTLIVATIPMAAAALSSAITGP